MGTVLVSAILLWLGFTIPASAQAGQKVVWVITKDGRISGYDAVDFHLLTSSAALLPTAAHNRPESISFISPAGLMLYTGTDSQPHLWNFHTGREIDMPPHGGAYQRPPEGGSVTVANDEKPQVFFGADGKRLFWFENRMKVLQREGEGDISRTGEFIVWTTGIDGSDVRTLANVVLPECNCDTGVCEETCPQIRAWVPAAGVDTFFYLSQYVAGQLSEEDLDTDLYQATNDAWRVSKLRFAVSKFLDAREDGDLYIGAIPDAGCCGWENESDDTTYVDRKGKRITLFDEFARFRNQDYDISFYTSNAEFSPDGTEIAYTIAATSRVGERIRLADQGKANPGELHKIVEALGKMPQVELVAVDNLSEPRLSLAGAQLIGWSDIHHLLVWKGGQLFLVDTRSSQIAATNLKADSAARVLLQ